MAANVGEPIPRPGARGGRWVTIGESRLWCGSYRYSVAHSTTPQTGRDAGPWLACKFSLLGGVDITGMFGALVATDGLRIHRGVGLRVAYCVPAGVRLPDHSWVGHGQIQPVARGRQLGPVHTNCAEMLSSPHGDYSSSVRTHCTGPARSAGERQTVELASAQRDSVCR